MESAAPRSAASPEGFHHERRYRAEPDPWTYEGRGAELVRYEWVTERARALTPARVLDVGCGQGQLTARLATVGARTFGVDLAPTAVRHAGRTVASATVSFTAGSATDLPFASGSIDVVVASDGPYSWDLPDDLRGLALIELHRVLASGGHAIFTEHMRMSRFDRFLAEIRASPLQIVDVGYLHDRPWYQIESWFRAVQSWSIVKAGRRSTRIARMLMAMARPFGRRTARHICVVCTR